METKKLALTIVFAAIAIVLNPALTNIALPYPFAQFLIYQIWEIPIVIAFLIISPLSGITVALLNTGVLLALFPGTIPTGPLYNLLATLSMQMGIYVAVFMGKRVYRNKTRQTSILKSVKWLIIATVMGISTRAVFMTIIQYFALPQAPPIGYGFDQTFTVALLPLSAFFNITLAAYTIPIGWLIARSVQIILPLSLSKT
ncbi:MAG: hypothetical protein LBQ98_04055 [Nitrososphaerota archaeon]|jgi:riboflavin transporter FmnP|nr:hypothetical protein [Nitrososphaerota archaeon]